jgi:hypothetical protein
MISTETDRRWRPEVEGGVDGGKAARGVGQDEPEEGETNELLRRKWLQVANVIKLFKAASYDFSY